MGMYDRMYAPDGVEWQTKAFGNLLNSYRIGDRISGGAPFTYQVQVYGSCNGEELRYSYSTIRDGVLASIDDQRDESLPSLDYNGRWEE